MPVVMKLAACCEMSFDGCSSHEVHVLLFMQRTTGRQLLLEDANNPHVARPTSILTPSSLGFQRTRFLIYRYRFVLHGPCFEEAQSSWRWETTLDSLLLIQQPTALSQRSTHTCSRGCTISYKRVASYSSLTVNFVISCWGPWFSAVVTASFTRFCSHGFDMPSTIQHPLYSSVPSLPTIISLFCDSILLLLCHCQFVLIGPTRLLQGSL